MTSTRLTAVTVAATLLLVLGLLAVPVMVAAAPVAADGICGPGGTGQTVAGTRLDAEQMANAALIVSVTHGRGLPAYAATVALATAYQESKFRNIQVAVDHDSLGLFQQRVVYFTAAVAADPVRATNTFLDSLIRQPNWQTRTLTEVAADIQRPDQRYRGLYARWQPLAAQLTAQLWPGPPSPGQGAAAGVGSSCPGWGADAAEADPAAAAAPAPGPGGLTLTGSPAGNGAVAFALAQLGEPYLWGGTGPGAWDCSGLTMTAWASVGVPVTRVTYSQATQGIPTSLQAARSGDLVLIPGSNGTPAKPMHVGMIAGVDSAGTVWLVEAPRTGLTVRLLPIRAWANQIVTIRRVG
jgi:cell wall-associated NlpC family hydrolase